MRSFVFAALAALTITSGIAQAANVRIDDLAEGPFTVSVDQCPPGVSPCLSAITPFGTESGTFVFTSDIPAAPAVAGTFFTTLLEGPWAAKEGDVPGDPSDTVIFTTVANSFNITVTVCSDPDLNLAGCSTAGATPLPQNGTVEDGSFQLVGQYVFVHNGQEIDNFYMASDSATPEPASMLLLGAGLAGVVLAARKRKAA